MCPTSVSDYSDWIGRSETVEDVASRSAVLRLAALLDRTLAPALVDTAILAPTGHWLQFTPTVPQGELGDDGHPRLGAFMPQLDLPRRMWAGSAIEYSTPIRVGQRLCKTTRIESITPKVGSAGQLCFVELRHDVSADDVHALVEWQTIVYQAALPVAARPTLPWQPPRVPTEEPQGWAWVEAAVPDERALFRYSAATFNAHRIHYDLRYATDVEGYPGLVVQGPLSATLIVSAFLDHHPDAAVTRFEFSARSPVFAGERIHIVGRPSGSGTEELALIAPGGGVAVAARIVYR
ncbi:MAG: MaoC family dehydratase N-terminal domain-containing protein [Nocardioides sp.]|uniref:FAS1-like dehydratase domain-containing protein n=1 Tax=Nocardioides sp. TaxID=35761 RepID=UPI0039E227E6